MKRPTKPDIQSSTHASSLIVAYNLKQYRKAKEVTQQQVAHATGLALRTYQELESGNANPTLFTLDLLAQYHGVVLSRLLTLSSLKLQEPIENFLSKIKKLTIDSDIAIRVRDFDGVIIWGNHEFAKIVGTDVTTKPMNLLISKFPAAEGVLRAHIEAEAGV